MKKILRFVTPTEAKILGPHVEALRRVMDGLELTARALEPAMAADPKLRFDAAGLAYYYEDTEG